MADMHSNPARVYYSYFPVPCCSKWRPSLPSPFTKSGLLENARSKGKKKKEAQDRSVGISTIHW